MASLGEQLKNARIAKNKSLEEISSETNISKRYLTALEENDYSVFPAQVYASGFLKSYAKFLEIDPQVVVEEYNKLIMMDELANTGRDVGVKDTDTLQKRPSIIKRVVIPLVVAIFIIMCVLAYLWFNWFKGV